MSSRLSPSASRSRSSAPAKTVQVELMRRVLVACSHGAELVEPHLHLVGDVPQVAPGAGRAAVVHLEVLDDAAGVDLDGLGVLAADVEDGAGPLVHEVGAQPVAEDL
jgi:hypothetical protein